MSAEETYTGNDESTENLLIIINVFSASKITMGALMSDRPIVYQKGNSFYVVNKRHGKDDERFIDIFNVSGGEFVPQRVTWKRDIGTGWESMNEIEFQTEKKTSDLVAPSAYHIMDDSSPKSVFLIDIRKEKIPENAMILEIDKDISL